MFFDLRQVATRIDQRAKSHIPADSGETIKIGYFHVAELMMRGPGCREVRALYATILAPRSDKRQVAATEPKIMRQRFVDCISWHQQVMTSRRRSVVKK